MRYREKLNIIFMRDNGPRRSIKIRRSNFLLLAFIFGCLPFLCVFLLVESWILWQSNIELRASMEKLESEYQLAETRAERLENLETLLNEEKIADREVIIRQLGSQPEEDTIEPPPQSAPAENPPELTEGPGHEEFPALDNGRVKVANVQARLTRDNQLRIGFDLRNPDNEPLLSGKVSAILVTANGERRPLKFSQEEIGNFRISRFKRTVMLAPTPRGVNMDNSQIILEVNDQNDKPLYRNVFAVQQ